jgi:membrane protease YdiL (CAAX protease family)
MRSTAYLVKKYPLWAYFIVAYALSWMIEIPLALSAQGSIQTAIPKSLHYLAGYGPMLSAMIVTGLTEGFPGLKKLWSRMVLWRVKPKWWLAAVSPLGLYLFAGTTLWVFQGVQVDLVSMGEVDFLPPLGLAALPLWILTFGIGEETGWRGFVLPRLQEKRSALSATLILWVLWALWHLPMFFFSYQTSVVPGMLMGLLAGSIMFTWLYNSTGGSVLIAAVWHGLFNATTACATCKDGWAAPVLSTAVMVGSVLVVIWCGPKNLSVNERRKGTVPARSTS